MRPDVIDLREFYHARLGQVARNMLRRQTRRLWPDVTGLRVLGLGYATPYLRQFRDQAERVIAVMPAQQGVTPWPSDEPGLVSLADECELPLPDASIDRILMVHAIEHAEQIRPMLREAWRVLASGGRLLAVVPNRRGLWSRFEHTPFGHGLPYSPGQLSRLLRETMFQPTQRSAALFSPPVDSRILLRAAGAWEAVGLRYLQTFAGVLLVEADKQIYAVTGQQARVRARPIPVVVGNAASPASTHVRTPTREA